MEAFARTRLEFANIQRAFETLASPARIDRYLSGAFALFWFFTHQYGRAESYSICRRGLGIADEANVDLMARTKVAYVGSLCAAWVRAADAEAIADRCAKLASLTGDTRAQGWAEHARSVVALNQESGAAAEERRTETFIGNAREFLDREQGDPWWDPDWERAYRRLGYSTFGLRYPARADDFEESGRMFESIGDEAALAIHHAQALHLTGLLGDTRLMELVQRGAEVATSPMWASRCQSRIGLLHQCAGKHEQAIQAFERSRRHERAVGGGAEWGESRNIICSLIALGRKDAARTEMIDLLDMITELTSDEEVQRSLTVAALVLVDGGRPEPAAVALGASNGAAEPVRATEPDPRVMAILQDPDFRELRAKATLMSLAGVRGPRS